MKHLIAVLITISTLTACGKAPIAADLSIAATPTAQTNATVSTDTAGTTQAVIDYLPRAATTVVNALAVCDNNGRRLCGEEDYNTAYAVGGLQMTVAAPGNYWMTQENVSGIGTVDLYQAHPDHKALMYFAPTLSRQFYCCSK